MLETLLALVALVFALRANSRIRVLTERLDRLQAGQGEAMPEAPDMAALETTGEAPETPPRSSIWARRRAGLRPGSDLAARFGRWLKANWIYPVAGLALVTGRAVFLVQYSIEKGLRVAGTADRSWRWPSAPR